MTYQSAEHIAHLARAWAIRYDNGYEGIDLTGNNYIIKLNLPDVDMAKVEVNLDRASETNKINVTSREIKEGNLIEINYNFDIPMHFDTRNAYV